MRDPLLICKHLIEHYGMSAKELKVTLSLKTQTFYNFIKGSTDRLPIQAYRNLIKLVDELSQRPTSPDISLFLPDEMKYKFVVDAQEVFGKEALWVASNVNPVFSPVDRRWRAPDMHKVELGRLFNLPADEKPMAQRMYVKEGGKWRRHQFE